MRYYNKEEHASALCVWLDLDSSRGTHWPNLPNGWMTKVKLFWEFLNNYQRILFRQGLQDILIQLYIFFKMRLVFWVVASGSEFVELTLVYIYSLIPMYCINIPLLNLYSKICQIWSLVTSIIAFRINLLKSIHIFKTCTKNKHKVKLLPVFIASCCR